MRNCLTGVLLFAAGWLWADPSITVTRVQQRYPWNGMVDIDYRVEGVPQPAEYGVVFSISENGNSHVLHEFLDTSRLYDASNGTWRATWNSEWEDSEYRFFSTNVVVHASIIYYGADKSVSPYGDRYLIVDLTKGTTATAQDPYPVETRYYPTLSAATAEFNTTKYKTTHLVLRRVHAGTFQMGSPVGESGRQSQTYMSKETRHTVTLTQDFYMGLFELTGGQYIRVMGGSAAKPEFPQGAVGYQTIRGSSTGSQVPPNFGQFDADSFMGKLSSRTGLVFDLPTEAQWEYACRAGTDTITYAGGSSVSPAAICWYIGNSGNAAHAVGGKLPNAWGFYDMLGNLWELCRDRATKSPDDNFGYASSDTVIPAMTDPVRDVSGGTIILRGGAYYNETTIVRAATRNCNDAVTSSGAPCGFRVSSTVP